MKERIPLEHFQNPLIILGMHRSGTSLLSRFIDEIGYFTGMDKQRDNESLFFLNINSWILNQYNASWDNVHNYKFSNEYMDKHILEAVKERLKSRAINKYIGSSNIFKQNNIDNSDQVKWGWKDPRNSVTLDVWQKIFKKPKIIHIYRNPIDVYLSLKYREEKHKESFKIGRKANLKKRFFYGKVGYQASPRVEVAQESFSLWKDYTSSIYDYEKKGETPFFHVKYEDFLNNPRSVMKSIADYLNVFVEEEIYNKFENKVNSDNKYKFINNKEHVEFYKKIKDDPLMVQLGYNNLLNQ